MIDAMVERVARQWVTSTMDPEVKYAAERDWDGFLEMFTAIFELLMPLFEKCLLTSEKTKARASAWLTAVDGGRKARRDLGFGERIRLAVFRRQFSRELGPEVSDELDDAELMRTFLKVTSESTPDEITQFRADIDRLRNEAA